MKDTKKEKEIDHVTNKIQSLLDNANLSYIEKFGILEVIRHDLHEEVEFICEEQ